MLHSSPPALKTNFRKLNFVHKDMDICEEFLFNFNKIVVWTQSFKYLQHIPDHKREEGVKATPMSLVTPPPPPFSHSPLWPVLFVMFLLLMLMVSLFVQLSFWRYTVALASDSRSSCFHPPPMLWLQVCTQKLYYLKHHLIYCSSFLLANTSFLI